MTESHTGLRQAALALIGLVALCHANHAKAAERVRFESARYQVGPLQQRLARERGETIAPPPAEIIDGYLTKPDGPGPFPAIVHLHGCNGLSKAFKDGSDKGLWSERLAAWGYVVFVVDSATSLKPARLSARASRRASPTPMARSLILPLSHSWMRVKSPFSDSHRARSQRWRWLARAISKWSRTKRTANSRRRSRSIPRAPRTAR